MNIFINTFLGLLHAWMGISGGFLAITSAFTVGYLHQIKYSKKY